MSWFGCRHRHVMLSALALLAVGQGVAWAQVPETTAGGYMKELGGAALPKGELDAAFDNVLQGRLNTRFDWTERLSSVVEGRVLWLASDTDSHASGFAQAQKEDPGLVRMSGVVVERPRQVLYGGVDRFYADWWQEQFEARVGRQRINWGTNLIWNPNDLFNPYSFFDFDYEERPGADALRLRYAPSGTSQLELVGSPSREEGRAVVGGLARFNRWETDIQSIVAYARERGVAGASLATQLGGAAIRGEVSYFTTKMDLSGGAFVVAAVSSDYAFDNSLYLHVEALYNGNGVVRDAGLVSPPARLSAEQLTPARYSLFAEIAYDLMPLLRADLATVVNPVDGSLFVSPSLDWSVYENWDALLLAQLCHGDSKSEFGAYSSAVFGRVKWSF